MSEVKRHMVLLGGVSTKEMVESYHLDSALMQLTEMQEELAKARAKQHKGTWIALCGEAIKQRNDYAKRLTAAEQRNATMAELLSLVADDGELFPIRQRYWLRIQRAIKPTESGASE